MKDTLQSQDTKMENASSESGDVSQPQNQKNKKRCLAWLLVGVIALSSFGLGIAADRLFLDGEMRALLRLKNRIQTSYYTEITDEQFYNVIFSAINEDLLDGYSQYMTADEYAQSKTDAKGSHSGLGLVFSTLTAQGQPQMRVVRVCGNSPAENKGIQAGDYLIGYGKTEQTIVKSNNFTEFSLFVSSYDEGESLYIELQNAGVVNIAKAAYVENYVFYRNNQKGYGFAGEKADVLVEKGTGISTLPNDTAYIRLTQFNGNAAEEFAKAMDCFKTEQKKNLILDLRGNGGGYMDIMREIAGYFCKNSDERRPIVAIADYGDRKEIFRAKDNVYGDYFTSDSRICVLADNASASASECLLGCMIDYGAISYGDICLSERDGIAKTYGKGIMQTTYPLSIIEGDAVKLTTAKICWPKSEKCIHGVGILPKDGTKTVQENYQGDEELIAAITQLFS